MRVCSENINIFLKRLYGYAYEILEKEMGLKINRTRFTYGNYNYPFTLVAFEGCSIGYFNSSYYQIGINRKLMFTSKIPIIKNVLRHELAHFITYINHGNIDSDHGYLFKQTCDAFRFDETVKTATINIELENEAIEGDLESEKIITKIKKLMMLSQSSNSHEAELATIKANQLLLKHNLESLELNKDNVAKNLLDEEICIKEVVSAPKRVGKHKAITDILKTFFVSPVICHSRDRGFYLEVVGKRQNVEMAEYVAQFLDVELEKLWIKAQKNLSGYSKGAGAKNSFMLGIANGYVEKINKAQNEIADSKTLVIFKEELREQLRFAYGRLGNARSSASSTNSFTRELGRDYGHNLNIHIPLNGGRGKDESVRLLSH